VKKELALLSLTRYSKWKRSFFELRVHRCSSPIYLFHVIKVGRNGLFPDYNLIAGINQTGFEVPDSRFPIDGCVYGTHNVLTSETSWPFVITDNVPNVGRSITMLHKFNDLFLVF
jgi:hypothetical protein